MNRALACSADPTSEQLCVNGLSVVLSPTGHDLRVLEDISLNASAGEITAVLGRSGSGKSTLLNVIAGFTPYSKGSIQFAGQGIPVLVRRGLLAYQNQNPLLLPWLSIRANLEVVQEVLPHPAQDALQILQETGLTDCVNTYPAELSGGMYQRVAFARALYVRPKLLLLDEPFSALDELTRLSMYEVLQRHVRQAGMTCLLVTHDVTEALRLAQRCVVISGRPARIQKEIAVTSAPRIPTEASTDHQLFNQIIDALA